MSAPLSRPTPAPLTAPPAGVLDLLEAFSAAYGDAELRLWMQRDRGRQRLFPSDAAEDVDGPDPCAIRRTLHVRNGAPLELEVRADTADEAAIDFLVRALTQVLAYESEAQSAALELSERYEEINLLYSISEILGSVLSLETAAGRILAEVADTLSARRASLWVYEPEEDDLHLRAAVGEEGLTGPIPRDDPVSVTARVFRERQPLNLERGAVLPRPTRLEPRPRGHEAFLSVPINYTPPEGAVRTVGVITLVGRSSGVRFSAGDAKLLSALASQVGAAIEIHRLVRENVHRERLEHELELAHDLQLKLLPETSAFGGGADVAARCEPAESVGGDFYHLFRLSGGRLGAIIGDVSSHGFAAALIMAMTLSAVAIYAQEVGPPSEVLRRIHRALIDELEATEMHLSLFYGVLDPGAGRLTYANAGHPHAFRVRGSGAIVRLGATHPPLGTQSLDAYRDADTEWECGHDLLCLFTDGLSDAFADTAGAGGEARLVDEVVRLRDRTSAEILARLFDVARRARPPVPFDDQTAVLLRA